jgi:hypothetical protein
MLPTDMLVSMAWRTLPHAARTVLTVLAAQYTGHNNGSLTLTEKTARDYGVTDPHMLYSGLHELCARGLIVQTRPGTRIPPLSAMYALGWRQIDDPGDRDRHDARPTLIAPDEWRKWITNTSRSHWTIKRRAPRWGRTSRATEEAPVATPKMAGYAPVEYAETSLGRTTASHISGRGGSS